MELSGKSGVVGGAIQRSPVELSGAVQWSPCSCRVEPSAVVGGSRPVEPSGVFWGAIQRRPSGVGGSRGSHPAETRGVDALRSWRGAVQWSWRESRPAGGPVDQRSTAVDNRGGGVTSGVELSVSREPPSGVWGSCPVEPSGVF